jgi:hypothetical protein
MYYILSQIGVCPALAVTFNAEGEPTKLLYWQDKSSAGGPPMPEQKYSTFVLRVPEDDGASWTWQTLPRGDQLFLETVAPENLRTVYDRLYRADAFRRAIVVPGQAERPTDPMLGGADPDLSNVNLTEATTPVDVDDRPQWQKAGFASKARWIEAGRP